MYNWSFKENLQCRFYILHIPNDKVTKSENVASPMASGTPTIINGQLVSSPATPAAPTNLQVTQQLHYWITHLEMTELIKFIYWLLVLDVG